MNCVACGTAGTVETKMAVVRGYTVYRQRTCICGHVFRTREVEFKPPKSSLKPEFKQTSTLGLNGSLNSTKGEFKLPGGTVGGNSGSDPDPDLNPNSVVPQDRARERKGRGDALTYPVWFEAIWEGCRIGRRGNKYPALKAFLNAKPSRPDTDLVIKRWSEWMQTDQFQRGMIPHLSTWANARGWEDPPTPEELAGTAPSKPGAQYAHARAKQEADRLLRATEIKSASLREAEGRTATPDEIARLRAERKAGG